MKNKNGEGTVYYNESKHCYVGMVTVGRKENGKLSRKTVYGKTKKEVQEKVRQIVKDVYWGKYIEPSKITIYDIGKRIIEEQKKSNRISDNTYLRKKEILKMLEPIYNAQIQKVTDCQIKEYLWSITKYSKSTISKQYDFLKKIFHYATLPKFNNKKLISNNIMLEIEKPKTTQHISKVRALTNEEQKSLIDVLNKNNFRYGNQMLISMLTGMRMGEVNALRVEDINFEKSIISIKRTITIDKDGKAVIGDTTKTNAGKRQINMISKVNEILRKVIGNKTEGLIFIGKNNKVISTNQVKCQFDRILNKYDILDKRIDGKVTLHSLRHTYATRAIEANINIKVLQNILGHKNINTTMDVYCDVFNEFQKESVEKLEKYYNENNLISDVA